MGAVLKAKTSFRLRTCCRVPSCWWLKSVMTAAIWETVTVFLRGAMLIDGSLMEYIFCKKLSFPTYIARTLRIIHLCPNPTLSLRFD